MVVVQAEAGIDIDDFRRGLVAIQRDAIQTPAGVGQQVLAVWRPVGRFEYLVCLIERSDGFIAQVVDRDLAEIGRASCRERV